MNDYPEKRKNAPDKGRGQPKCFHTGIILIVIYFKLVFKDKIKSDNMQVF